MLSELQQSTQYLKYEVIQNLVNRNLPQHLKGKKISTPKKDDSHLEIVGLY